MEIVKTNQVSCNSGRGHEQVLSRNPVVENKESNTSDDFEWKVIDGLIYDGGGLGSDDDDNNKDGAENTDNRGEDEFGDSGDVLDDFENKYDELSGGVLWREDRCGWR